MERRLSKAGVALFMALASGMSIGKAGPVCAEETMTQTHTDKQAVATFAGGCFWCMQGPFEQLPGVHSVTAGYTGGREAHPTYEQVSSGSTGHAESIQVIYDPALISYEQLLDVFWRNIDPTQANGQFSDVGSQYRTAIFYHDATQQRLAAESQQRLAQSGKFSKPIATQIVPASAFYPAEDYHQDYYKKHPLHYKLYRIGSGREGYLHRVWGEKPH